MVTIGSNVSTLTSLFQQEDQVQATKGSPSTAERAADVKRSVFTLFEEEVVPPPKEAVPLTTSAASEKAVFALFQEAASSAAPEKGVFAIFEETPHPTTPLPVMPVVKLDLESEPAPVPAGGVFSDY